MARTHPIPKRLAEKIWRNEFIELHELLPSRLGVPQPTLMDVLAPTKQRTPLKQITTIERWVTCFNTFMTVVSMKHPDKIRELLAYSSIVVGASEEFEGTPWLEYDTRFRKEAALDHGPSSTRLAGLCASQELNQKCSH